MQLLSVQEYAPPPPPDDDDSPPFGFNWDD
jgi:hypothetical protein